MYFLNFYVYECFCLHVCICTTCVPGQSLKQGFQIVVSQCGCQELNLDPLQEQNMFVTSGLFPTAFRRYFYLLLSLHYLLFTPCIRMTFLNENANPFLVYPQLSAFRLKKTLHCFHSLFHDEGCSF